MDSKSPEFQEKENPQALPGSFDAPSSLMLEVLRTAPELPPVILPHINKNFDENEKYKRDIHLLKTKLNYKERICLEWFRLARIFLLAGYGLCHLYIAGTNLDWRFLLSMAMISATSINIRKLPLPKKQSPTSQ